MPDETSHSDELPFLEPLELGGHSLNLDRFLKDFDDISEANVEIPAICEWINTLLQEYVERKIEYKQLIKEIEADVYLELLNSVEGKKTDAILSKHVVLDERVKKVHRTYARYVGWVYRLQNLLNSFQSKLDLVRSTESTRRKVFPDEPQPRLED